MFYSVQEVSKILQVTRATIYNRIDKMKELNKHVKIKDNVKYIDDEGVALLRVSMNKQSQCQEQSNEENNINENIDSSKVVGDYTTIQKLIETFEKQLEVKDKQLDIKDRQLEAKDKQLEALAKLNENNQVLLKQVQDKVFLLESPIQEANPESIDTMNQQPVKDKKWWDRFFGQ